MEKMKKRPYLLMALAALGLVGVVCLQFIWLYNTYILIKNDVRKEISAIVAKALEEEGNIRFRQTPEGTEIMSGPTNDTIPPITYFYEALSNMGYPLNMESVDSVASGLLSDADLYCEHDVLLKNPKTGEVLQRSGNIDNSFWMIVSEPFPIRADYSQTVQIILSNPQKIFFERMGMLLAATAILMAFVIGCIVYLIKIISKLNRLKKKREEYTYAMIHDMKMPLSTIAMVLDFWHKGKLEGKAEMKEKYCRIAEDETGRLLSLANRVLTISKLENDKLDMNREWVKLAPLVQKVTERFATKTEKSVHFDTDLQVEAVYADAGYLEEILSNLIDNSLKYSDEEVHISISAEETGGEYILRVHDDGWGISRKSQRVIFEKFERGDMLVRKRKSRVSGFGLGLNFVMQVMEAHGGRVTVNSIEGDFTEICVCFPKQGGAGEDFVS